MIKDNLSHQNKSEFNMVQDTLPWLSLSIRSYVVRCRLKAHSNNCMIHIPANWICCHTGCCDDITIWKYMLLNIYTATMASHDDVITWKSFPHHWPFMGESTCDWWVDSPQKAIDVKVWWLLLAPTSHYWADSDFDSVLSTWYSLQCPYNHYMVAFILPPALKRMLFIVETWMAILYLCHLPISLFIFKFFSNTSI